MRQSRNSFTSASVDFATGLRNPMPYSFDGCAPRHDSMSRKLSLKVNCHKCHRTKLLRATKFTHAKIAIILRNQTTKTGPRNKIHDLRKQRSAKVHGGAPERKNRENYHRFVKRRSNRHQMKSASTC